MLQLKFLALSLLKYLVGIWVPTIPLFVSFLLETIIFGCEHQRVGPFNTEDSCIETYCLQSRPLTLTYNSYLSLFFLIL